MAGSILFITPYPYDTAGSQRFRFELFYPALEEAGWQVCKESFMDEATWDIIYKPGHASAKILGILKGFFRRIILLFRLSRYDHIFIHREASPIGPPFFEFISSRILGRKYFYDFDDAIWKKDVSAANPVMKLLKSPGKVPLICKWAGNVIAGNDYLAEWAGTYNHNVHVIPTGVDTDRTFNKVRNQSDLPAAIGWTGTITTLRYIESLMPVLDKIHKEIPFTLFIISDTKPGWERPFMQFIRWTKESEVEDLLKFHIGLMPLTDDEWAKGKCGFKAIQYLSLGIPAVASDVGVNSRIVKDGINGFLIRKNDEWESRIRMLLTDNELRTRMGAAGPETIRNNYSTRALAGKFLALFES